jgi:hypothetical protein
MILSLPNSNEVSAIRSAPRAAAHVNPHGKGACVKIYFAMPANRMAVWNGEFALLAARCGQNGTGFLP